MTPLEIDFPFHVGARGATATTAYDDHVRDMVEQLLFTRPGERVNRPDLGCGLLDLVFEPNGEVAGGFIKADVEAALQRYLGDLIALESVNVTAEEATLRIDITYILKATGQAVTATLEGVS
jgi:phage baseplate assembly protein W